MKKLNFKLGKDGTFRILHLTDIQDTMYPNSDTLKLIDALLTKTKPDLVILTGDQLKGYSLYFKLFKEAGVQKAIFRLMSCFEKRHVHLEIMMFNVVWKMKNRKRCIKNYLIVIV